MITPYRLAIFAAVYRPTRLYKGRGPTHKGAYTAIEIIGVGWLGWTADQAAEPARLIGSGTFLYYGALRALIAVRQAFRDPRVRQVQIRTNQDCAVLIYNRQPDGRVTHYRADELERA